MGYKDKSRQLSLDQQVTQALERMQAFGQSKHKEKREGDIRDKIFSVSTYRAYKKHCLYFVRWVKEQYPEVTNLRQARRHMDEWLTWRDGTMSAYTAQLEAKALAKLYQIGQDDPDYHKPPVRHRADIKRSRGPAVRDKNFNPDLHRDLIDFCTATGLRRAGMGRIRGCDLWTREDIETRLVELLSVSEAERTPEQQSMIRVCQDTQIFTHNEQYFVYVVEKGGRPRLSPIIGPHVEDVVERFRQTKPTDKVWPVVNSNADIHSYRAVYANSLYREYARPLDEIPYDTTNRATGHRFQSQVYVCRGDMAGKRFDRPALQVVEKALGHNSLHTFVSNYFRE